MAEREEFVSLWKKRYPSVKPPELSCFTSGKTTKTSLERSLANVQKRIEELNEQVQQHEFIAAYLHEKLYNSALVNGVTVEESADLDSPVPSSEDSANSTQSQPVVYTNVDSQNTPAESQEPATAYTGVSTFKPSTNVKQSSFDDSPVAVPPDRLSRTQPNFRSSTLQYEPSHRTSLHTDLQPPIYRNSLKKTNTEPRNRDSRGADSFSGTRERKSINKPPVPTPRSSIKGPAVKSKPTGVNKHSILRTESSESADSWQDNVSLDSNPDQGDSGTDSPGNTPTSSPHVSKTPPLLRPLKRSTKMKDPVIEDTKVELKTFKKHSPSSSPTSRRRSPTASPRLAQRKKQQHSRHVNAYATVDIDFNRKVTLKDGENESRSMEDLNSTLEDDSEHDYDNPVPVNMRTKEVGSADDSSSDDEEPVYLNIMLMKKQSLNPETIYASVNMNKKGLSKPVSPTEVCPPVPPKSGQEESPADVTPSGNTVFLYPSSGDRKKHKSNEEQASSWQQNNVEDVSSWRRRSSMKKAFESETGSLGSASSEADEANTRQSSVETRSICSVSSESEELDNIGPSNEAQEKLAMRKWVVTSILDSENNYVSMLDVLLHYMRGLQAAAQTSQPVLTNDEIDVIFQNIPELHAIHARFIKALEPKVENWNEDKTIGECFKMLSVEEVPVVDTYCTNYQKAIAQIHKSAAENPSFSNIIQDIKWKGSKENAALEGSNESATLEELLHKPVVRIQRNILVLHDLIKCTPTSHSDYDILQKTLIIMNNFLENFQCPMMDDSTDHQRYLVKNHLLVEKVGNKRKLRQVFVFNDVIVCTKQKLAGRQRLHFDVKWFVPMQQMVVEVGDSQDTNTQKGKAQSSPRRQEIDSLQKRVSVLRSELRSEIKRSRAAQADGRQQWSIRGGGGAKNMEKIKKKLAEQEEALMLASPQLVFRLKNSEDKTYTLLMSSDYERNSWKETITALRQKKSSTVGNLTTVDLQNHINNLKLPKLSALSMAEEEDWEVEQEHLFGALNITIHRLQGLNELADTYCCMEVDSYNHFFVRAKTKLCCNSSEPVWNENFEIDLDGAQTLRILCYKSGGQSDTLLGKCALELSKAWLRGDFHEKTISLNKEVSLIVSLSYASRDQTIKRTLSSAKTGLFGVRIGQVAKREGNKIPIIVRTCVEEVENKGLDDVGIYRVSGLSSEIQRMKKGFEKNAKGMAPLIKDCDINVVTGLLKLYLRELPEALFTDKLYPSLLEGNGLSDPEAKQKCMLSLMRALPEPNYTVALFLIDHLVTVSKFEDQNKMTLQNLATVFGPTLLRPATGVATTSADLFSLSALDAMMQSRILHYFLTLRVNGVDFTK